MICSGARIPAVVESDSGVSVKGTHVAMATESGFVKKILKPHRGGDGLIQLVAGF